MLYFKACDFHQILTAVELTYFFGCDCSIQWILPFYIVQHVQSKHGFIMFLMCCCDSGFHGIALTQQASLLMFAP